ncbi:MAG: cob(I)yrinic acid a,c-diamide adenosyltransferase [Firmicutes bacterium]|nr:cob(I)yrinic acid a,c-diamide adenosyltransferase [Bacillota bacterium]
MGKKDLGLVHIYCGEGKGKTTCSVGLTVRASAYGHKVLFMQFLKPGTSSELKALRTLPGVTVVNTTPTKKFTFMMTDEEKAEVRERNAKEFLEVVEQAKREEVNMLVMDETLGAIEAGVLDEDIIVEFLQNKPEKLEVVMTGRYPSDRLVELADYVSRLDKVKHPYDAGIPARAGIED